MKTIYVGIDISKDSLDVAVCIDLNQEIETVFQVENSLTGISKMISKCKRQGDDLWFCFEHTGNYGLLLSTQLEASEQKFSSVPALEIKQSQGMVRGKTDKIDARRIATYAATNAHKLKPTKLAGETLLKIKSLLAFRMQLSETIRGFKNSLKSHQITNRAIDVSLVIRAIDDNIESLEKQMMEIEKQILDLIDSDEGLKKNYLKATSVPGIGPIITFYMLVHTNNFTSFDNPRKFNCYCGLAPFEHSSGSSIKKKTKTSNLRNKKMKSLLFNGANSAVRGDLELKSYYKRKKEDGKHHQLIMNNIACKLVNRVFAVIKRDELFVKLQR